MSLPSVTRLSAFALALCAISLVSVPSDSAAPTPGYGTNPELAFPQRALIPTINIAPAKGWAEGEKPHAATGFTVNAFAQGLDHPRWIYVLPNGDVLVAE